MSDELIGYCRYRGGILVPEDGDSYDIDEKIDGFDIVINGVTVNDP